jgi:tetratricopeptide (TPR) repeat protein
MQHIAVKKDLASVGIESPSSLLGLFLLSEDGVDRFVGKGPLNTDDLAFLEHSASRCFGRETTPQNIKALLNARQFPEFLFSGNHREPIEGFQDSLFRIFQAREKTMVGRIATYRGDFAGSAKYYRSALEMAPEDGVTKILLADALETLASIWANNGDQNRRKGKLKEAVAIYSQALQFDSRAPRAHNGLGLISFAQGNYKKALRHFDIALQQYPKQAQIRCNRALALLKLNRLEEARQEIEVIEQLETGTSSIFSSQLMEIMSQ